MIQPIGQNASFDRELPCSEGDPECTMAACAYDEYYGGADKRCPNCPMTADKNVELAANITMLYFLDIEMAKEEEQAELDAFLSNDEEIEKVRMGER